MRVKVKAPATIANFGPGFDVFGICLKEPSDTLVVEALNTPEIEVSMEGHGIRSPGPVGDYRKNTAGLAASAVKARFLQEHKDVHSSVETAGFSISIWKGIRPGSGLGSSAASAAGAAFAANYLLHELTGKGLSPVSLAECAAAGEGAAGGVHPDNTTPALFGGFTVAFAPRIRYKMVWWEKILNAKLQKEFPDAAGRFRRYAPPKMYLSIIFPDVELKTKDMRDILVGLNPKPELIKNNIAYARGVVDGFKKKDLDAICRSLKDCIVTPARKGKIPHFDAMERAAYAAGAKAFILCGSGPSVAAVSGSEEQAGKVLVAMKKACRYKHFMAAVTEPGLKGVELIDFEK